MKSISIVTPCFNEEGNVRELCERVRAVMCAIGKAPAVTERVLAVARGELGAEVTFEPSVTRMA